MPDFPVLKWDIRVPLWRSALIRRQLALAVGLPFGTLLAVMCGLWLRTGDNALLYAAGFILGVLVLGMGFALLIFRGVYDVAFTLDNKQAVCETREVQARRARRVGTAAAVLGLFTGNFSAAGVGMLAQSRLKTAVRWDRVRRVRYAPRGNTITLNAGFGNTVVLFCTSENYAEAAAFVGAKTAGNGR